MGHSAQQLARSLKNYDIKKFFQTQEPHSLHQEMGVYKIKCGDFDAVHIGQTGRALEYCMAEHNLAVNAVAARESAFDRHILTANKTVPSLHYSPKGKVLNKLEEIQLITHKKHEKDDWTYWTRQNM